MARDDIKRRIAALLSMTTAAGCTEAEAMVAAQKAAALMAEYGLSEGDIHFGQSSVRSRSKGTGARDKLWWTVAMVTNTAPMVRSRLGGGGGEIIFVGAEPGPQIAAYLFAVLNRAVDAAISGFKAGRFYRLRRSDATRRAAVHDFTVGMVSRLQSRLVTMFRPSISKDALAVAQLERDRRFPGSVTLSAPSKDQRFQQAMLDGWKLGGDVPLSHGVGGADQKRRIGGVSHA